MDRISVAITAAYVIVIAAILFALFLLFMVARQSLTTAVAIISTPTPTVTPTPTPTRPPPRAFR